jgi:cytochrome c553
MRRSRQCLAEQRARRGWRVGLGALLAALALIPRIAAAETIEEKAQICATCHGENGVPPQQAFPVPIIWGQNLGYLFFQLRDFKSGARKSEQMSAVVDALEPSDLMALAQYFANKPWPNLQQKPPPADAAAAATRISAAGGCTNCHHEGLKGEGMQPRLAGQVRAYLQKTMADFACGARATNPGMTRFMKGLTEDEIAALAAYLAAL